MRLSQNVQVSFPWMFFIATLLLFSGIGLTSIYALDEAKNAEAAREMLVNNDFIVPTFNQKLRTDKPPLHYFFIATAYKVAGTNPFTARFFSSIMGLLTLLITYLFTKRNFGQQTAVLTMLVLFSSVHFLLQMQMAVPDPYLIFLLTAAFFSFYELWKTNERKFWWFFYIAIGLGVLAKGPIAIALPGFVALLFLIFTKTFTVKDILRLNPFVGLLVSLTIAFPWYYFVHIKTGGEWTQGFFFDHNINRFSEGREGHSGLPILTLAFVALGFLPFLFFLPQSIAKAIKQKKDSQHLYLLLVAVVVVGFFSFSGTKLPNYTVPSYPALAILLASYFATAQTKNWQWLATALFCFLLPIGAYFGLQADDVLHQVSFLAFAFLIPFGGALLAYFRKEHSFRIYTAAWMIFGWLFFTFLFPRVDAFNPLRQTKNQFQSGDTVVAYKQFNPAYVFYLQTEIPVFNDKESLSDFLTQHEDVVVISRKKYLQEIENNNLHLAQSARDIFETPTTVILRQE